MTPAWKCPSEPGLKNLLRKCNQISVAQHTVCDLSILNRGMRFETDISWAGGLPRSSEQTPLLRNNRTLLVMNKAPSGEFPWRFAVFAGGSIKMDVTAAVEDALQGDDFEVFSSRSILVFRALEEDGVRISFYRWEGGFKLIWVGNHDLPGRFAPMNKTSECRGNKAVIVFHESNISGADLRVVYISDVQTGRIDWVRDVRISRPMLDGFVLLPALTSHHTGAVAVTRAGGVHLLDVRWFSQSCPAEVCSKVEGCPVSSLEICLATNISCPPRNSSLYIFDKVGFVPLAVDLHNGKLSGDQRALFSRARLDRASVTRYDRGFFISGYDQYGNLHLRNCDDGRLNEWATVCPRCSIFYANMPCKAIIRGERSSALLSLNRLSSPRSTAS